MRTMVGSGPGHGVRLTAIGAVTALLLGYGAAAAQEPPFDRGVTDACDQEAMEADRFADVHLGMVHSGAIDCLWVYNVVQGQTVDGELAYLPSDTVTREQMATFVVGAVQQILDRYHTVPAVDPDDLPPFEDAEQISTTHQRNVNVLYEMGVVQGFDDDTFRPAEHVNRAQMASYIALAIEAVIDEELPRAEVFDDISGVHQDNIEKLAAIGVVQGQQDGTYGPAQATTRAQMATFIARGLDYFVERDVLQQLAYSPQGEGARLGLTDVEFGVQEVAERVTFTLEGDERRPGWRIQYVDEAIAHGSGKEIDVEGDAILQVVLTGMALPPELDEDLWDEEVLVTDGDAIVEVVDVGVFEGQQLLFIGTTDVHPFGAARLDDPHRVYIDVHPTD